MMESSVETTRVTIYLDEHDQHRGKPLHLAILELLRREGASGATVVRGLAGFGADSRIHSATIVDLAADLPIRLEWIDGDETVQRLLPAVRELAPTALITAEPVTVIQTASRVPDPLDAPVSATMQPNPVSVSDTTPIGEVMDQLLALRSRSLPVVDADGRLVGILTDGDLLHHAGHSARLAGAAAWHDQLAELRDRPETAASLMTAPARAVHPHYSLREAAAVMVGRDLKRLPVVDESGLLVGIISRIDILRAIDQHELVPLAVDTQPADGQTVVALMDKIVPTVSPDAPLDAILQAIQSTGRRRVVVTSASGRVVGIVTDGDLLRQIDPAMRPGLLARLRTALGGTRDSRASALPDLAAADVMSRPVITIGPDTTLPEALDLLLNHSIKRLPVVDADDRLLGLLGRAGVLRGLLEDPT